MKPINLIIALIFSVAVTNSHAASLLNGLALEQEFNKDRYIAAVYTEMLSANASALLDNTMPRRLEIRVVAERLSARRLRNQWMEGIAINNPASILSDQAENMVTFANLFNGRLAAGDRLSIDFSVDNGSTSVSLNDTLLGVIEDREFFNTLLRAWVGTIPPSTDFRSNLLASGQVSDALLRSYQALSPSADRIAQIAEMAELKEDLGTQIEQNTVAQNKPRANSPVASSTAISPAKPILAADIPPPTLTSLSTNPAIERVAPVSAQPAVIKPISQPQALEPTQVQPSLGLEEPEGLEEQEAEEEAPLTADMILARQIYYTMLLRHTSKSIRYPKIAQVRGQEGNLRLAVTIDAGGRLKEVQTLQDSRYSRLNNAALDAVKRAAPYPAIPSQLGTEDYTFSLPITFQIPD